MPRRSHTPRPAAAARRRIPDRTLLDPIVMDHEPEYVQGHKQRCQKDGCKYTTNWRCPGCAALDGGGASAGYYCREPKRNCQRDNHCKRCRTKA